MADEKKEAKAAATLEEEAEKLGVKKSIVSLTGYNIKDKTPEKTAKEQARHEALANKRLKVRVAGAKVKMKPVEKRKALLVGRFRAVKAKVRANTYTNANIEAWTEEYNLIISSPKQWNKITKNGTVPYTPGNKKKRNAKERLEGMNFDDEEEES